MMKNGLRVISASADKIIDALHKLNGNESWSDRVLVRNSKYIFVKIIWASIIYPMILAALLRFFHFLKMHISATIPKITIDV
jgi:hypothetical protein